MWVIHLRQLVNDDLQMPDTKERFCIGSQQFSIGRYKNSPQHCPVAQHHARTTSTGMTINWKTIRASKFRITKNQKRGDIFIYNAFDPVMQAYMAERSVTAAKKLAIRRGFYKDGAIRVRAQICLRRDQRETARTT
jgi:hypothetical protein